MNSKSFTYALRLLAKRDYSRAKLCEKLLQRDFDKDEIELALDELTEKKFLREDYYAEARVKGLMHKGLSPTMIKNRLAEENCLVESEFIDAIYGEYKLDPNDQIRGLVEKKLRSSRFRDAENLDYGAKQKIVASVVRKGHSPRHVFQVLEDILRNPDS